MYSLPEIDFKYMWIQRDYKVKIKTILFQKTLN